MKTLADAFTHTLKDVYYAEHALVKAMPAAAAAVRHPALKKALKAHTLETKAQIQVLRKVFRSIGTPPSGERCDAIDGLIAECEGILADARGTALDAAIIGCCQAIEHYEIARYGTLKAWAKALGHVEAHTLLAAILDEEKAANHALTHLAVTAINQ